MREGSLQTCALWCLPSKPDLISILLPFAVMSTEANGTSLVTQEVLSSRPKSNEDEISEHLPQSDLGTASSTPSASHSVCSTSSTNVMLFFRFHSEAGHHRGIGGALCGGCAGVRDLCLQSAAEVRALHVD